MMPKKMTKQNLLHDQGQPKQNIFGNIFREILFFNH